jgi:hypothetical protein
VVHREDDTSVLSVGQLALHRCSHRLARAVTALGGYRVRLVSDQRPTHRVDEEESQIGAEIDRGRAGTTGGWNNLGARILGGDVTPLLHGAIPPLDVDGIGLVSVVIAQEEVELRIGI